MKGERVGERKGESEGERKSEWGDGRVGEGMLKGLLGSKMKREIVGRQWEE